MDVLSILALNSINGGGSPTPGETVDATVIPFDPVEKTGTMTNPVGIDENGRFWASGSGSGGATTWDELEDKPFESVGSEFESNEDGELKLNSPAVSSVSDSDYVLVLVGGALKKVPKSAIGGAGAWEDITGKPFSTVGTGLKVEGGALMLDGTIPTKVSDLTNDSEYLTLDTLPIYNGGVV